MLNNRTQDLVLPLLDFCFLKLDMLARDRIVFTDRHFLGHRARVLLRDVEEACTSCADKSDFRLGWLRHGGLHWAAQERLAAT